MPFPWLAAATIAGSLISSKMGKKAGDKQAAVNAKAAADNIKHQKEFAQHGIRWKVKDAQEAGIHPLAAIGANTQSFAPVSVGDQTAGDRAMAKGVGDAFSNLSQIATLKESEARQKKDEAMASYYSSMAAKNSQKSVAQTDGAFVGQPINLRLQNASVPHNEPVGTQRTYNLDKDSDVQNWEDKYGDIPGAFIGGSKLVDDYGVQLGLRSQITGKGNYRVRNGWLYKKSRRGWRKVRPIGQ